MPRWSRSRPAASSARASPARCRPAGRSPRRGCTPLPAATASLLCSGDMLLEALVACAGVTLRAVATSLGIEVDPGHGARRGRPRLPRHARRRPRRAGRLLGDPPLLRARHRCRQRAARDPAEADRALLRRLPDHRQLAAAVDDARDRVDASMAGPLRHLGELAKARVRRRAAAARRRPGAGRAGGEAAGAAGGAGGRMARRLRLPDQLRGTDAVHRPLPLAGALRRPAAAPADPARPGGARPLRPRARRGGRRPRRPHPLRPRGRRAGDRAALRLQGLRLRLAADADGPARPRRAGGRGRALPHLRARPLRGQLHPERPLEAAARPRRPLRRRPHLRAPRRAHPRPPTAAARSGGSRSRSPGCASTTRAAPT